MYKRQLPAISFYRMLCYIIDIMTLENTMQNDFFKKARQTCYTPDYTLSTSERMLLADYAKSAGLLDAAEKLYKSLPSSEKTNICLADTYRMQQRYGDAKRLYYDTTLRYSSAKARKLLNGLCLDLSKEYLSIAYQDTAKQKGLLRDFDGREIAFERSKIPVKGKITAKEDKVLFELELNVLVRRLADMHLEAPARPIIQGIKQWQGSYSVFGGYPVEVKIKCTSELKRKSSLIINIFDDDTTDSITGILQKLGNRGKRSASILSARRQSAALLANQWRLGAVKYINLYEQDLLSIPKCKFLMRHEFGHILGLDDMYAEPSDGRMGVNEVYPDIEMFKIRGNLFNMVMCSVDAPVTFKDIEMVLLAYMDGEIQRFQLKNGKGKISRALNH